MTDFTNGFDPTQRFHGAQFNAKKHGKGPVPEQQASPDVAQSGDPYASQRLSPDEVFGLMNAQARFARAGVDATGIFESIAAFENALSPENHAQMMQDVASVFQDEFGFAPSAALAETIVADHLIGKPSIQAF
jgi:hypothetical protein